MYFNVFTFLVKNRKENVSKTDGIRCSYRSLSKLLPENFLHFYGQPQTLQPSCIFKGIPSYDILVL